MYRNHSFNPPSEEAEKAFAEKAPTITLQGAHQQSEAFWESQRPEEASVGIENIFKFLRIYYVWRLTYLEHPNIQKGGVRMTMTLSF